MHLRRRLISCLFLACATPAPGQQGVWLEVPFVSQQKNGCGAASVAMVMRYWRRDADPEQIQRALYSPKARGIYASDLERYLRRHGFSTYAIKGEWTDLRQHLEKGRPLIVALKSGRADLHYVVVTGLDPGRELVLTNDPARRKLLRQHRADFERAWKAAGSWTLLALPSSP